MKTVLITGITSDIGKAIAELYVLAGWYVIGQYSSSTTKAKAIEKRIKNIGGNCSLIKADLTSESALKNMTTKIKKYKIDVLINNAGGYVRSKRYDLLDAKLLYKTFMLNTFSPIILTSEVFKEMKKRKFGRIINISSIAAKYGGSANSMHYGCSKLALEGVTKTLAREGAASNVLVNTVRPGVIDTAFHKKFKKDMKKRIAMIPVKQMGKPQQVADAVFYLGTEKNTFITNEIITIAGGE